MSTVHNACERLGIMLEVRAALDSARTPVGYDVLSLEGRREYAKDAELKFLRAEVKRLQSAVHNQESFFERLVEAARHPLDPPEFRLEPSTGRKRRDVILHLSDLHYGELVREEDTPGGLNVFNRRIFRLRLERYVKAVIGSLRDFAAGHTLDNLIFALGGDIVTGDEIFPNQIWALDRHPVEQVLEVADLLSWALREIMHVSSEELGMSGVYIYCVPGNHGRMKGTKRSGGQPPTYSWDWLVYKLLERDLANYPVNTFGIEPAGVLYFGSKDHIFQLSHGHEIRGALSISFYGVGRFDARSIRTQKIIPDALLLAHYHQAASIPIGYGESLHNGSFLGANNLAQFTGASPASQNLYLVSEEFGPAQRSIIQLQTREERNVRTNVYEVG